MMLILPALNQQSWLVILVIDAQFGQYLTRFSLWREAVIGYIR